ncbi:MAG: lipoyl synthase [Gammaproteobacteria bacterium]|nr:lipoyl synthase [Gammaproteobacteria bacterium]
MATPPQTPPARRKQPGVKLRGAAKLRSIPVHLEAGAARQTKPPWIRVRLPAGDAIERVKAMLRRNRLHTVCEEASCPNLPECFGKGTATFMIMGDICTRRCAFCDVAHGRPLALDADEPARLAGAVNTLGLRYVVVTSVDRDDLRDGGAAHFAACIRAVRERAPATRIEVLVPDFRGRMDVALEALAAAPPDVFNHNLETVPRLYPGVRPGADYRWSLALLARFKERQPAVPTKSGLMLGLGERLDEVEAVMHDLRAHGCDMLTLGQYLQPSRDHHPVLRFVTPAEFERLARVGAALGFAHVASGPMVRSSYHADEQAAAVT